MSHPLISQALAVIQELGLPRAQHNDRSALCLLALLNLTKEKVSWADAEHPLMGITPIMEWVAEQDGRVWKPNTRESVRRQTMHQFVDAGIALTNPDEPTRAVNSPKWVYQVEPATLALLKTYGTKAWTSNLTAYRDGLQTLIAKYAKEREMNLVPVVLADGTHLSLSAGEHSELIKAIIEEFAPRFAPGSSLLYAGDTGEKLGLFDEAQFKKLGLTFNTHGKMPDVVLWDSKRNWLLLVESVTSHGPVDGKRHNELAKIFANSSAGLVYVTAFPNRSTMARYLTDIAWETEVWTADAATHLIHFNGDRYLGPHGE